MANKDRFEKEEAARIARAKVNTVVEAPVVTDGVKGTPERVFVNGVEKLPVGSLSPDPGFVGGDSNHGRTQPDFPETRLDANGVNVVNEQVKNPFVNGEGVPDRNLVNGIETPRDRSFVDGVETSRDRVLVGSDGVATFVNGETVRAPGFVDGPVPDLNVAGASRGKRWGYRIVDESQINRKFWRAEVTTRDIIDGGKIAQAVLDFHSDAAGIVGGIEVFELE